MRRKQESTRSMYIAVRDYLNTEIAVWSGSAGMTNAVGRLTMHIENIDTYSLGQQEDTKSATKSKLLKRNVLVGKIIIVADGLRAYGNATGDTTLAGQAKVTKKRLVLAADTLLMDVAEIIIQLGIAHAGGVVDYNVSGANVTALETARTAFRQDIQKPKNLIGKRKTNTSALKNEFEVASKFLINVLDALVRTYTESNRDFVLTYFNNREIFDAGRDTIAVRFRVEELASGMAMGFVEILIMPGGIKKRTTEKGGAQIQFLHSGAYTAVFSKAGFVSKTETFYVTVGEMAKVVVGMEDLN